METKTTSRWRPKKDFWELKSKLAVEAAENKGKLGRWRPKKQRTIDDSINTKISNHHKDVTFLEKKNQEIHESISSVNSDKQWDNKAEKYSKIALCCSIVFFIFAILYRFTSTIGNKDNDLIISELNNSWEITNNMEGNQVQMQIWYNDENWDFVEVENIEIANNGELTNNNIGSNENTNILVEPDKISNSDVELIKSFYDKINNRNFSELTSITDRYLRSSDAYRTYFSSNWLNNFLDKIAWNRIFVSWFSESPSDKPNVKHYRYNVKYKVLNSNELTNEEWEIVMVDRNWERLIWSIMCITTWCSRMPFFQK